MRPSMSAVVDPARKFLLTRAVAAVLLLTAVGCGDSPGPDKNGPSPAVAAAEPVAARLAQSIACTADEDCPAGAYCASGGMCMTQKATGTTCANADCADPPCRVCQTGNCADGFCCNTPCSGSCDKCDGSPVGATAGTCAFVAMGSKGTPDCNPFYCSGNSPNCPTFCASSSDCQSGLPCLLGLCVGGLLPLGGACTGNGQCLSGHCSNGVCCDSACDGQCATCLLLGGLCLPAARGNTGNPTCSPYACNGLSVNCPMSCDRDSDCQTNFFCASGTCTPRLDNGGTCDRQRQCRSGFCVDGTCCNSACTGPCNACNATPGTCTNITGPGNPSCSPYLCNGSGSSCPTTCSSNSNCEAGSSCVGNQCVGGQPIGTPCTMNGQCHSMHCANGVCCDTACNSACDVCNRTPGVCTPAQSGTDGVPSCGSFVCNGVGTDCPTVCGSDRDCAAGLHCASGNCVSKSPTGSPCTDDDHCTSGFCADGFCCNSACNQPCDVCNAPAGTCTVVAGAGSPACSPYMCNGTDANCPTSCNGNEDCIMGQNCVSGLCTGGLPVGTTCTADAMCHSGHCIDGVCCQTTCDGPCNNCNTVPGSCTPSQAGTQVSSCGAYVCNGTDSDCPSACTRDSDCKGGFVCPNGICETPVAPPDAGPPPVIPPVYEGGGGCSASGPSGSGPSGSLFGLFLLAAAGGLALVRARRGRPAHGGRNALWLLFFVAAGSQLVGLRAGHAQARPIDTERWHPGAGWDRYLSQEGAARPGRNLFGLGLYLNYADGTLQIKNNGAAIATPAVETQVGLDLIASYALWNRLLLSVDLPVRMYQRGQAIGGLQSAALGDVLLGAKLALLEAAAGNSRFGVALAGRVGLPTGSAENFAGSGSTTFEPRLIADWRHGEIGFAAGVGARLRDSIQVANIALGSELTLGAGLRIPVLGKGLVAIGEIYGGSALTGNAASNSSPVEALGGLRARLGDFEITAAAGRGINHAYGSPALRLIGGLQYAPRPPEEALPMSAPDGDGDGIPDAEDACPNEAGLRENHGCPDVDSDGDGVVDRLDRCKNEKGIPERAGCPDPDADGDSVLDLKDRCPRVPGPAENEGCPDRDTDGDGLVDRKDKCPDQGEVFNGFEDDDGCPDKGEPLVVLGQDRIEIRQAVQFNKVKFGSAQWQVSKDSYLLLGTVAKILFLHPEITKVQLEGHTDNRGTHAFNEKLSRLRAQAIRDHLVDVAGVQPERLTVAGFAYDQPIASNKTAEGRAKNRRVEIRILERTASPASTEPVESPPTETPAGQAPTSDQPPPAPENNQQEAPTPPGETP